MDALEGAPSGKEKATSVGLGGTPSNVSAIDIPEGGNIQETSDPRRGINTRGRRGRRSTVAERQSKRNPPPLKPSEGTPTMRRKLLFEVPPDKPKEEDSIEDALEGLTNPWSYYNHFFDLICPVLPGMGFFGMELDVSSYIFGRHLPAEEIICPLDGLFNANREALQTLCPNGWVSEDVLTLVAAMAKSQNEGDMPLRWWLPPLFSKIALNPTSHDPRWLESIKLKFMGKADHLVKICIPMHLRNHWYLMVLDMTNDEMVYFDSNKDPLEMKDHLDQMNYAYFVQKMLADPGMYKTWVGFSPKCSDYHPAKPKTGMIAGFGLHNGCCNLYFLLTTSWRWAINDMTRMRLTVDLVLGRHNPIRTDVGKFAVDEWDRQVIQETKRKKKAALVAEASSSVEI
ncbi:hypothetical protein PIB30_046700 [Stylosanthes scabra]|uniref:Ubiquitin-like protease family profile domain-containing protein n=1 Tax=Stylosanthes scabra TaxID=79078 RepID=A0ABU6WGW2_9FABA|nr:hypothetical protein [Stylosanthes scabra]